jgi:hypothetical protein
MEPRTVFGDVMEVVTADNDGTGHLGGDNTPREDATTNGHLTGKWTLFICSHCTFMEYSKEVEKAYTPM